MRRNLSPRIAPFSSLAVYIICQRRLASKLPRSRGLQVPAPFRDQIVGIMRRWVETVATSPTGKRHHLYPLATAIGRLAYRELIPELKRLLDEDLGRLRKARDGFQEAQWRGDIEATSDARAIYGNQYQDAFVRVGGDEVAAVVAAYLEDPPFSVEAALVLMALANKSSTMPAQPSRPFPVFANVAAARTGRTSQAAPRAPSRSETAIFDAIDHLGRADKDRESQLLAIRLGGIALIVFRRGIRTPFSG
jgi:hypothetical protein